MLKRTRSALMAAVLLALPVSSYAGTIPAGTEFQANTYTTANQYQPQVCSGADGSFVVVWSSYSNQDGYGWGVFAQRYASGGARLGTEFQVNTYTPSTQNEPQVCCDAAGDFVVVWASREEAGQVGIFGQRFASTGTFLGTEFQVNSYTTNAQVAPALCCDAAGDFVVTWTNIGQGAIDILGRRFASDGAQRGTEFQVNTYSPNEQEAYSAVCCDAPGDFVVAWQSLVGQKDSYSIFAQRFASDGNARGSEFQVNTYTTGGEERAAICCDNEGDFTIVWDRFTEGSADIFGQRYASSGAARGTEFQVNAATGASGEDPSICCGPNGDFVVAWSSYAILARRFSHLGGASSEFQVNTYTSAVPFEPAVACDANGGFVVVWSNSEQDGDFDGVFGQRFALLAQIPTPTLSFAGIAAGVVALLGAGWTALRRRRRG